MTKHDEDILNEFQRISKDLEKFFYAVSTSCPYGLPFLAVYKQCYFGALSDQVMEMFLASGYRRNGNILYTMNCRGCRSCVPIRISSEEFSLNRSQKRVIRYNEDVSVEMGPLEITEEKLTLCDKFLKSRYPDQNSSGRDSYSAFFINSVTNTCEVRYRIGNRLLGVAIVDYSDNWMNAVYFFFDPEEEKRSPGVFNILHLIDFCMKKQIDYLYLGYWINEVSAMNYKARFKPHQVLTEGSWTPVI